MATTACRSPRASDRNHCRVNLIGALDGNRTSKTTLTGNETYSYAAGFKLTGITGTDGNEVYAHDADGRLTGIDRGGVHRTVEYDSMDHITRVVDGGIEVERYTFDGQGRRVSANDGTGLKRFLVAPSMGDGYESPQAVTDRSGNLVATFVYAGERPIAKITPTGIEYFLSDAVGTVIGKANPSGVSTASIRYDAFGNVTMAVGTSAGIDPSVGGEPRFQGMTLDSTTGLYFVRARSYDARTARFVSRDSGSGSAREPERNNPYAFANSNPLVWADPSGHDYTLADISAALGAFAGMATQAISSAASRFLFVLSAAAIGTGIGVAIDATPGDSKAKTRDVSIDVGLEEVRRFRNQGWETLYRAVAVGELKDITSFGGFRAGPNSYEGKLFATTQYDAAYFARDILYPLSVAEGDPKPLTIVKAEVPDDLYIRLWKSTVDGRPTVHVDEAQLPEFNLRSRIVPLPYIMVP